MSRVAASFAVALAGFAVFAPAPARADSGPVIVIPSRPGIPVVINGRDASYAVVEGDWGLSRPGAGAVTVIGGMPVLPNSVYTRRNSYHPKYGRAPLRGRNEIEPAADRALPDPAEDFSRSWSTSSDMAAPATITDPATFPNNMNGINGALINNNSNNRNSGNTNTNSNNSQSTNYNNSTISNTNTNSNSNNNTNSNNPTTTNNNTNSNNTTNTNSNNNSSRNTIGNNGGRRHHYR